MREWHVDDFVRIRFCWSFALQYNTAQYYKIQCSTVHIKYNVVQYNTIQCSTVQCNTMPTIQLVQYNTMQYYTTQYNTMHTVQLVQYNTRQYGDNNTIQYNINTKRYGTTIPCEPLEKSFNFGVFLWIFLGFSCAKNYGLKYQSPFSQYGQLSTPETHGETGSVHPKQSQKAALQQLRQKN